MRGLLHKFLLWLPAAAFGGPMAIAVTASGVAQAFPEAKSWIATRYLGAVSALPPMSILAIALIASGSGIVWLTAVCLTYDAGDEVYHHYANPIREELESVTSVAPIAEQLPPVTVWPAVGATAGASIAFAEGRAITAEANVTEEPDTLSATIVTFPTGLYVGSIIASADKLSDEGVVAIGIRSFNGTSESLRVTGAEGFVTLSSQDNETSIQLPLPAFKPDRLQIPPLAEFLIVLEQHIPPALIPDVVAGLPEHGIQLELRNLNLVIETEKCRERRTRLPLWDGILLRRRDDIMTGRVSILDATPGLFVIARGHVTISRSITRADGSIEHFED